MTDYRYEGDMGQVFVLPGRELEVHDGDVVDLSDAEAAALEGRGFVSVKPKAAPAKTKTTKEG